MAEDSEQNGVTEPVDAPDGEAAGSNDLSEAPPEGSSVAVASVVNEVEEAPEDDCPPCKGGAPAWMATFADMATLLMAFFVLILSLAQMNVPMFKEVSGSMNDSMGVQAGAGGGAANGGQYYCHAVRSSKGSGDCFENN